MGRATALTPSQRDRLGLDSPSRPDQGDEGDTGEDDGRIVHVVLDRSFVCGALRYIVDFKTGAHLGGDASAFLRQEFERYEPQLARYARIVRAFDARPVRIALYHPLVDGGWQEHAFTPEGASVPVK